MIPYSITVCFRPGALNKEIDFLRVLEAESPNPRCQQVWLPLRPPWGVGGHPLCPCRVFAVPAPGAVCPPPLFLQHYQVSWVRVHPSGCILISVTSLRTQFPNTVTI